MTWNQSGGNGNRDPWNSSGKQPGPPDLDEALKKLREQLNNLFGNLFRKGPPSTPSIGGRGIGTGGVVVIVLVVLGITLLAWTVAGMYVIKEPEAGVVLRFGKYDRTLGPGFNWAPKFVDEVIKVNVNKVRTEEIGFRKQGNNNIPVSLPSEALMLTADENIVDIQFAVQYEVNDPADWKLQVADPELTLRQSIESAVREIVGRSKMDDVITEQRDRVADEVRVLTQTIIDRYRIGVQLLSVNMQDAQPPKEVQSAFLDAIKAREDQERIINEAKAYAADIVPKARGEADAIHERAEGYKQRIIAQAEGETSRFTQVLNEYRKAPEVTRERLYIETIESILANTSKVIVDVEGGSPLLYLPLDKILKRSSTDDDSTTRSNESNSTPLRSVDGSTTRRTRNTTRERIRQ